MDDHVFWLYVFMLIEASISWQDCRNSIKLHKAAVEEVQTWTLEEMFCRKGGQTQQ